jgi:multidrug transporter EmrE-like cation transporter
MLFSYGNLGPLYTISKGLSVILVAILSWLLLGQRLSLRNIISIIIIIIGIALMDGYS